MKQQLNTLHQELTSKSEQLTTSNRQLHERDLRLAQINSDYENLQHRFKLEVANHKIELAKVQRDQLEKQEQLNLHVQGEIFSIRFNKIPLSLLKNWKRNSPCSLRTNPNFN